MVIFHSYVKLPEGIFWEKGKLELPLALANSYDPGGVILVEWSPQRLELYPNNVEHPRFTQKTIILT